MATITLPQELAMWGIHPFMPQIGIYAGGYQGIFYPNPTTLLLPTIRDKFEPLDFRTAEPSNYTPNAYVGLGKGNPGIDYRNPGHVLGLIDTFLRMAYGLNVIKGLRTSEDLRATIINMDFQVRAFEGYEQVIRNNNNFYPDSTEIPTDYLDVFLDKITTAFDPPFITNRAEGIPLIIEDEVINNSLLHVPASQQIDFEKLFKRMHTDTYFDIRDQFIDFLNRLKTEAEAFESLVIIPLDFIPFLERSNGARRLPAISDVVSPVTLPSASKGEFINKCTTLSINKALELINGDGKFHLGPLEPTLDYRTFTELNAVANILPIQINGGRYSVVTKRLGDVSDNDWLNYFICDVNLNITNLGDPKTININGNVTFEFDGTNPLLDDDLPSFPILETDPEFPGPDMLIFAGRRLVFEMRSQNKFGWDKNWFDLEEHNQIKTGFEVNGHLVEDTQQQSFPPPLKTILVITPPPDDIFSFNETLDLVTGQNNLVIRIMAQSFWSTGGVDPPLIVNTTTVKIDDITLTLNIGDILSETFTLGGQIPQAKSP